MKIGQADITDVVIVANLLARAEQEQTMDPLELDQLPPLMRMKIDGETVRRIIRESDEEIASMTQALAS